MSAGQAIDVDGLSRTFTVGRGKRKRTVDAVQGLSFSVERGERLAFIGPNGAGKSTSIKMLTGILVPTAGHAAVLGVEPWTERRTLTKKIGALFGQRSQLWAELDPRASLRMLGAIYELSDESIERRVGELGELLAATELFDQPVRTLSLGQRMRCELAACMLHQPELLFLDEPTIGLDLIGKQAFRQMLVRLNEDVGTTVFLTSHDIADIEHVADRAIVVNHGSIIHDAPVAAMRSGLLGAKRIDVRLADPAGHEQIASALAELAIVVRSTAGGLLSIDVDTSRVAISDVVHRVLSAGPVSDLSVLDPPLEQVIGEIYERPAGASG